MSCTVYILRLSNGRLYVGQTDNLPRRLGEHGRGKGSRTARLFHVGEVIYTEHHSTRSEAVRRERQLKHWSRAKKEALIGGDLATLHILARCRHPSKRDRAKN